jgi:Zn-dependent protease
MDAIGSWVDWEKGVCEMGRSWKLGTIAGIEIRVHPTFLLALVWGAVMWGGGRLSGLAYGALLTLVLFSIVLLHELGHSLAAKRYGIPVRDITLLPIGGIARLSRMPEKPAEELVVALAGPAVNLAMILLLAPYVLWQNGAALLDGGMAAFTLPGSPSLQGLATFLLLINVSLLLFNLLPAFPLDGGRVLRSLLAFRLPRARATAIAATIGRGLAIVLVLYGLLTLNLFLSIIAIFIFTAAGAEGEEVTAREKLKGLRVTEALDLQSPALTIDTPPHLAFERLVRTHQPALAVMDLNGGFLGVVTAAGMQRRWRQGVRGPLSDFAEKTEVALDCGSSLDSARQQMLESQAWVAPVYCGREFAGLLNLETIGRILSVKRSGQDFGRAGLGTTIDA